MMKSIKLAQILFQKRSKLLFRRSKFLKRKQVNERKQKKVDKINSELVDIQTKLLKSHEAERARNEASVVKGIKKNSKLFFKYAKKFRKFRQSIVTLKNEEGESVNDAESMCEKINMKKASTKTQVPKK